MQISAMFLTGVTPEITCDYGGCKMRLFLELNDDFSFLHHIVYVGGSFSSLI